MRNNADWLFEWLISYLIALIAILVAVNVIKAICDATGMGLGPAAVVTLALCGIVSLVAWGIHWLLF